MNWVDFFFFLLAEKHSTLWKLHTDVIGVMLIKIALNDIFNKSKLCCTEQASIVTHKPYIHPHFIHV